MYVDKLAKISLGAYGSLRSLDSSGLAASLEGNLPIISINEWVGLRAPKLREIDADLKWALSGLYVR